MILKLVHNNKMGAYALMLLLILLVWIKPIANGATGIEFNTNSMPLWNLFSFAKNHQWLGHVLSIISTIIITLNITRFNSKYALLSKQSALPGLVFVLMISGMPESLRFSPIWITTILLIISLEYLFIAHHLRKTMKECFLSAFWLSLSCLFYYKVILLIPLLVILMLTLRVLTFRSFLATLIGISLPWILTFGYYFAAESSTNIFHHLIFSWSKITQYFNHSIFSIAYLVTIGFLFILALFSVINAYGTKKIFTRKQYQVFIYIGIYISVLMAFTGTNIEFIPLLAFPYAIIISHLIDHIKSWLWKNVIMVILFTIALMGQIFL